MKHFLAVDLGATSGRTILSTVDGEKVVMREFTRFKNPQIPIGGHIFWDLPHLFNEILNALRKVAEENIEIESIGIDTWGCDFAFFGSDGLLSGLPYCYRDTHTDGAMEDYFSKKMSREKVYEKTGIQFMPFNSLFQLHVICQHSSINIQEQRIAFIPDALSYMLTGEMVCEYTVASTSQLLNPVTGDLDNDLLESIGIRREQFGRMVQPGERIGTLTPQIAEYTGLGPVPVVAVAGHDTASAVIAVPSKDANFAYLSCGTWSLLGIESPHPIITKESAAANFTNEGGIDGTTRFLKNITGLWIYENCRREWGESVPQDVNALNALCMESSFEGLINPDDASFAHPASMTEAICTFFKNKGEAAPQTPADFVRCIFRSLARRVHEVLELLAAMSPNPIERLHVIGGGSLNGYLMQFIATETGMPVITGPAEGTALGNTMIQLRAADPKVSSLSEMRHIINNSITTKTYLP